MSWLDKIGGLLGSLGGFGRGSSMASPSVNPPTRIDNTAPFPIDTTTTDGTRVKYEEPAFDIGRSAETEAFGNPVQNNMYQNMLSQMGERYNQSPEQLEDIMGRVGYHESKGRADVHQYGGGPGRGLYQFETGAGEGGETAMRRLHRYFKETDQNIPDWAQIGESGVDASQLTPEQQGMMFLANVRYHPQATLEGITSENLGTDFWAPYHWAGADEDKEARLASFDKSMRYY